MTKKQKFNVNNYENKSHNIINIKEFFKPKLIIKKKVSVY